MQGTSFWVIKPSGETVTYLPDCLLVRNWACITYLKPALLKVRGNSPAFQYNNTVTHHLLFGERITDPFSFQVFQKWKRGKTRYDSGEHCMRSSTNPKYLLWFNYKNLDSFRINFPYFCAIFFSFWEKSSRRRSKLSHRSVYSVVYCALSVLN